MQNVDYYKVLGLEKTATPKEIKNAYRKLARKFHPDLNAKDKEAKRKFQEINEANEILSDVVKRKKYDQNERDLKEAEEYRKANQNQPQSRGYGGQRFSNQQNDVDFSSFFDTMYGGGSQNFGRNRQTKFKGEDLHAQLNLELTDVIKTQKQTLNVNGKSIRITIPAGIENEQTIKIAGYGSVGENGGQNGDLYIKFSIVNNTKFNRVANNLSTTVDLDLYTAILGGEITLETLSGKVKLKVLPETQNGTKINLKGKGFPIYKNEGHFGDLQITYNIKIPTNLSEKQKNLFEEIRQM